MQTYIYFCSQSIECHINARQYLPMPAQLKTAYKMINAILFHRIDVIFFPISHDKKQSIAHCMHKSYVKLMQILAIEYSWYKMHIYLKIPFQCGFYFLSCIQFETREKRMEKCTILSNEINFKWFYRYFKVSRINNTDNNIEATRWRNICDAKTTQKKHLPSWFTYSHIEYSKIDFQQFCVLKKIFVCTENLYVKGSELALYCMQLSLC